jgi:hypothetical protein
MYLPPSTFEPIFMAFEPITDAPWYVPNAVIRNDLQIPTIKEEITRVSSKYSAGLNTHPNHLVTQLSNQPTFRRLRKLLPSDLPYRFTQNTEIITKVFKYSRLSIIRGNGGENWRG